MDGHSPLILRVSLYWNSSVDYFQISEAGRQGPQAFRDRWLRGAVRSPNLGGQGQEKRGHLGSAATFQRRMIGRMLKSYRTASFAMSTVLAGMTPLELVSGMYAEVYEKVARLKREGASVIPVAILSGIKLRARLYEKWKEWFHGSIRPWKTS